MTPDEFVEKWAEQPDFEEMRADLNVLLDTAVSSVFERSASIDAVRRQIRTCEGQHQQQVCFSTFHDALTQVCWTERRVRTNAPFIE